MRSSTTVAHGFQLYGTRHRRPELLLKYFVVSMTHTAIILLRTRGERIKRLYGMLSSLVYYSRFFLKETVQDNQGPMPSDT